MYIVSLMSQNILRALSKLIVMCYFKSLKAFYYKFYEWVGPNLYLCIKAPKTLCMALLQTHSPPWAPRSLVVLLLPTAAAAVHVLIDSSSGT